MALGLRRLHLTTVRSELIFLYLRNRSRIPAIALTPR
jgi:hypothetical protein